MSENETHEMVVVEEKPQGIVRVAGDVLEAFEEYRKLQEKLDAIMKDSTMEIRGKLFRKKSYWRAIATAFNLNVDLIGEQQIASPTDENDWGWVVTYVARATNGRFAIGDGACFASEKSGGSDTVHNVRGHAHTRGYNRAVSNLVGFGEVSAEEVQFEQHGGGGDKKEKTSSKASNSTFEGQGLSERNLQRAFEEATKPQILKIKATARELAKVADRDPSDYLQGIYNELDLVGVHSTQDLSKRDASRVIEKLVKLTGKGMTP